MAPGASLLVHSQVPLDDGPETISATATNTNYGNGLRPLVEEKDTVQTLNVYGPGNRIVAQVLRDAQGNEEVRYLVADHLGSTRMVLDKSGNSGSRFDHTPYIYASYNPVNRLDPAGGDDGPFVIVDYNSFFFWSNETTNAVIANSLGLTGERKPTFIDMEELVGDVMDVFTGPSAHDIDSSLDRRAVLKEVLRHSNISDLISWHAEDGNWGTVAFGPASHRKPGQVAEILEGSRAIHASEAASLNGQASVRVLQYSWPDSVIFEGAYPSGYVLRNRLRDLYFNTTLETLDLKAEHDKALPAMAGTDQSSLSMNDSSSVYFGGSDRSPTTWTATRSEVGESLTVRIPLDVLPDHSIGRPGNQTSRPELPRMPTFPE